MNAFDEAEILNTKLQQWPCSCVTDSPTRPKINTERADYNSSSSSFQTLDGMMAQRQPRIVAFPSPQQQQNHLVHVEVLRVPVLVHDQPQISVFVVALRRKVLGHLIRAVPR